MNTESNKHGQSAEIIGNAWRYWERRRLAYNGALALLALGWLVFTWPHFRPAFNLRAAGALVVLAVIANLGYSAVYAAELLVPFLPARATRLRWRNVLWLVGTLFALALEMYWIADEIYPHPTGP
ncbi:MAG TPA: hypothetical protein VKS19_07700 [Verrucomicrobiae bacterium]|nr:hypothetical protein [Verrucomicrobiae bacterium]